MSDLNLQMPDVPTQPLRLTWYTIGGRLNWGLCLIAYNVFKGVQQSMPSFRALP